MCSAQESRTASTSTATTTSCTRYNEQASRTTRRTPAPRTVHRARVALHMAQLASPPNAAPTVYVNVHSGIQELYFGWDWTRPAPPLPNQREVTRMYEHINSYHCSCKVGAAGKIAGYVVHGGSMDWMYDGAQRQLLVDVRGVRRPGRRAWVTATSTFNPQNARGPARHVLRDSPPASSPLMQYLIEEKFGVVFPVSTAEHSHLCTPLHMTEDKKTRNRLFACIYHTWKQIADSDLQRDRHALLRVAAQSTTSSETSSQISLPAFDPQQTAVDSASTSDSAESRPKSALRVLLHRTEPVQRVLPHRTPLPPQRTSCLTAVVRTATSMLLILPSLFPTSRAASSICAPTGLSAAETSGRGSVSCTRRRRRWSA